MLTCVTAELLPFVLVHSSSSCLSIHIQEVAVDAGQTMCVLLCLSHVSPFPIFLHTWQSHAPQIFRLQVKISSPGTLFVDHLRTPFIKSLLGNMVPKQCFQTKSVAVQEWWWWLFPHVREFWKNVQQFIP